MPIVRLLIFYILFLTTRLFADGSDIQITVTNASPVHESTPTATFTIQLSQSPDFFDIVTVHYTTLNGSAQAGSDYTATSGTVHFIGALGQTTKTITVPILNDSNYEPTEYFKLSISNSDLGYVVTRSQGVATIYDDDIQPLVLNNFFDKGITESDSRQTLTLVAKFNQTLTSDVTVTYHTVDDTASHGSDYLPVAHGSVTALAGTNRALIPLTIKGDTTPEGTERFSVVIDSVTQGSLTDNLAYVYIGDDDTIKVSVSSSSVNEGNVGDHNQMQFKITLAKPYPLTTPLTINYKTQDGSSPSATLADRDYISKIGTVTFNKGDIEKIVMVDIVGDNKIEPDENLKMAISGSSYIVVGTTESKILNDDGSYPSLTFSTTNFSIVEGNSSQRDMNFTLKLDAPAFVGSSFEYYTQDNTALSSDSDYVAITPTLYSVPVGATVITIPIKINGDTKIENDENFYLKIQNGVNLNIIGGTANGNIVNDDGSYPQLSFDLPSYIIFEGDSNSSHDLNITLQLDKPTTSTASFDYYTFDGSAKVANSDYRPIARKTYRVQAGEQNITIPVAIVGDNQVEGDEYFYFKVDNEHNLTMGSIQQVKGVIVNDDGSFPKVSIHTLQTDYLEGDVNQTQVAFSIELDTPATEDNISVAYESVDGTAKLADSDYVKVAPTTVTFNRGEQKKNLFAYIRGDNKVESDEQFSIKITTPYHAKIDSTQRQILFTILNDDNSSNQPFSCESKMYISSSLNRVTGATNRMWLHEIDTTQNPFAFKILNDAGVTQKYNAIAYNPDDNYIYGLYHRELLRFSRTGELTSLGVIGGLPNRFDTKQLFAGAIYGGYYYVTGRLGTYPEMYKIKLSDKNVTTITFSKRVAIQDFSFSSNGQFLYGVGKEGKLTKIDASTGVITEIGPNHTGFAFDSTYSDVNDRFFANDSNGHGFYEFNLKTGNKRFISNSQPATFNDGANCLNASLVFNDYGDAPKSYGRAGHNIANGIFLGKEVDHDIKFNASVDALGDDKSGIDDEDGVTFLDGSDINGAYLALDKLHTLKVTLSKDAYLRIWIDKDVNGKFDDVVDLVYSSATKLTAGTHNITFRLPATLPNRALTYLRARVSSSSAMKATGFIPDGEVEDYAIYFGTNALLGRFNIERTNSENYPLMSDERNAWYTQIVGRDFDYSLVFYKEDFSAEQNISNVTVRVDLINMDSNRSLYNYRFHIPDTVSVSRIPISFPHDLERVPATKNARFRVTYGVDGNGGVTQADCLSTPSLCTNFRSDDAFDNFAIRPHTFYVAIADGDTLRKENTDSLSSLSMASGYDYNLTLIASVYDSNTTASVGYTKNLNGLLKFNTIGTCADSSDRNLSISFNNGNYNTLTFNNDNVGEYILKLLDTKWTEVDSNKTTADCIVNSGASGSNFNALVGCNILSIADVNLRFNPYRFKVNFALNNLPANTHPDFIYMSELNATENNLSLQFVGDIVAQNEKNGTTTNFTAGCMAKDLTLLPDATVETEDGILGSVGGPTSIKTVPQSTGVRANVAVVRRVEFNGDSNDTSFATIADIASPLNIAKAKFLDENNGTLHIDLRHNIQKHPSLPINPVQTTLSGVNVNSAQAWSKANGELQFVPSGVRDLNNTVRNFYFAQVAPDLVLYPRVNFAKVKVVRTPLNVDIFCNASESYCNKTNIFNNTSVESSPRKQQGWYLSVNHDGANDGRVTALTPTSNSVTIAPATPIEFTNGRNGVVMTTFSNCSVPKVNVTIKSTAGLSYNPQGNLPYYSVECTENNASDWAGVGKAGNLLETKPDVVQRGRVDW